MFWHYVIEKIVCFFVFNINKAMNKNYLTVDGKCFTRSRIMLILFKRKRIFTRDNKTHCRHYPGNKTTKKNLQNHKETFNSHHHTI